MHSPAGASPVQAVNGREQMSRARAGSRDGIQELGETESLRLQMAMDRMSKMMETLSNMLRKAGNTANGIVASQK